MSYARFTKDSDVYVFTSGGVPRKVIHHRLRGVEGDVTQPWVWRYGEANNGTGASCRILATRVHADVASRLGGPIVVTVLSPWQAAYAFADEGYLDPQYVAEKLVPRGLLPHPDDLETLTDLTRLVLGRGAS